MIIPVDKISELYEKMVKSLNMQYISVVIYTSIDIDSLCALKIISRLLKSSSINFTTFPVTNYTELEEKIEATKQYEKVKLFMFINCGGLIDLTDKWFLQNQSDNQVFLLDSNRPIFHKNLQHPNITFVDDKHSNLENRLTAEEVNKLQELNEFDLEEELEQDNESQNDQNSDQNSQYPKRRAQIKLTQRMRKHRQLLIKRFEDYYALSYVSLPISNLAHKLMKDLSKADNFTLWYAIVGSTGLYLNNMIPKQVLDSLTNQYRTDMGKYNASMNGQKRQKGQIFYRKGYRFPLMNHWSLYESMMNSPYLMVKLGLWNQTGVSKLHQILTTIGISLDQAKQQYKYMTKELKDFLEERIFIIAEQYNLTEITYESFMNQLDNSSAYMASDICYIFSALLQKPIHKVTEQEHVQHRLKCFWDAYNILEGSQQMIRKTIEQYKLMSNIMMREVKDIIERDSIISINQVNFSNIRCDTKQKRLFEHPVVLMRLAYMLMGIQKQRKQQQTSLNKKISAQLVPCVVSLQDVDKNLCLIVGVVPDHKSEMGATFNAVSSEMKIQVKHDRFMSNVIVVHKDNLIEFIKKVGGSKKN